MNYNYYFAAFFRVTLTVIDDPEDVILQYEHVQISNEEDSITAEFLEDLIPGQNYSVSIVAVANDLKSDPVDIPFALGNLLIKS